MYPLLRLTRYGGIADSAPKEYVPFASRSSRVDPGRSISRELGYLANPFKFDPLFRLQNEEIRDRLTAAILSLGESERLVFTLYYYEGLTTEEVALMLDETASSVAQLHASALLGLRTRLARPGSEFSESSQ
jgi:RNA polymerase sigma factor (sigma-70 family)